MVSDHFLILLFFETTNDSNHELVDKRRYQACRCNAYLSHQMKRDSTMSRRLVYVEGLKRLALALLLIGFCCSKHVNAMTLPKPTANKKSSPYPRFLVHKFTVNRKDATPASEERSTSMDQGADHKVPPLYNLYWETRPLIGGPSWLPLHMRVVLQQMDSNVRHMWDFIPLDATNPETLQRLVTFQSTPGAIRYNNQPITISDIPAKDTTVFDSKNKKDPGHDPILSKAVAYGQGYPDCNLHLVSNNCWTFAWRLTETLKELEQ